MHDAARIAACRAALHPQPRYRLVLVHLEEIQLLITQTITITEQQHLTFSGGCRQTTKADSFITFQISIYITSCQLLDSTYRTNSEISIYESYILISRLFPSATYTHTKFYKFGKYSQHNIVCTCSCPLVSCDFITSGRSGGDEQGLRSRASNSPLSFLKSKQKLLVGT